MGSVPLFVMVAVRGVGPKLHSDASNRKKIGNKMWKNTMFAPIHLLPAFVLALSCGISNAEEVLEQARLKAFFFDAHITAAMNTCAGKHPDLRNSWLYSQQEFRQKLLSDIQIGREFGRRLATPRGRDIDKEAAQVADRTVAMFWLKDPNRNSRDVCEQSLQEVKIRAKGSIDDFLHDEYESLLTDVGNRQGLPCGSIAYRLEGIARRYIDSPGQTPDSRRPMDLLVLSDALALQDKISNCLAAEARVAEYRVVPGGQLKRMWEVLASMERALMPDEKHRVKNEDLAMERVGDFLREQGSR